MYRCTWYTDIVTYLPTNIDLFSSLSLLSAIFYLFVPPKCLSRSFLFSIFLWVLPCLYLFQLQKQSLNSFADEFMLQQYQSKDRIIFSAKTTLAKFVFDFDNDKVLKRLTVLKSPKLVYLLWELPTFKYSLNISHPGPTLRYFFDFSVKQTIHLFETKICILLGYQGSNSRPLELSLLR